MRTNHISQTSTPLNTSGGRNTERAREGKNDEVGLEHQTINSPLSLWVEGFGGEGGGESGEADIGEVGVKE